MKRRAALRQAQGDGALDHVIPSAARNLLFRGTAGTALTRLPLPILGEGAGYTASPFRVSFSLCGRRLE